MNESYVAPATANVFAPSTASTEPPRQRVPREPTAADGSAIASLATNARRRQPGLRPIASDGPRAADLAELPSQRSATFHGVVDPALSPLRHGAVPVAS